MEPGDYQYYIVGDTHEFTLWYEEKSRYFDADGEIKINTKVLHIATYDTYPEAEAARCKYELQHLGANRHVTIAVTIPDAYGTW